MRLGKGKKLRLSFIAQILQYLTEVFDKKD